MAFEVFSLFAKLGIDSSEYDKGLQNAMKVGSAAVGAATTAVVAFAKSAVDAGLSFDSTMSQVAAISGATGADFDALRDKAQEMGATTKFSASESAEALTYMAMAGWKTDDMLNGIKGIMNLAAASGENLASTSDIVTDALTAFGLAAEDSGHFADVLAAASSNANTNVSMLGESFKYVAPVAGALGFSAEDTSVALGLMANAGIKASQAGTALRTMMTNLSKPTDDMALAMETLGVSLTDEEGNMQSLMGIMDQLRVGFKGATLTQEEYAKKTQEVFDAHARGAMNDKAFAAELKKLKLQYEGVSEAEQAELAAMLAGKEGMSGLLAIVNASDEDFAKLTESIYGADGAAAQMAATMQDNLQGAITIMQSALEGLKIAISDKLTPSLREFVQFGSEGLSKLTTAFQEGGLSGAMDAFGEILSDGLAMIFEKLPEFVEAGAQLLGSLGEGIIANLPLLVESGLQIIVFLANSIAENLSELIPTIVDVILQIVDVLTDPANLGALVDAEIAIMVALAGGLVQALPKLIEKIPEIVENVVTAFVENAPKLLEAGFELINSLVSGITGNENLLSDAINELGEIFNKIKEFFGPLVDSVKEFLTALWDLVKDIAKKIADTVNSFIEQHKTAINAFTITIKSIIKTAFEAIRDTIKTVLNVIRDAVKDAVDVVAGIFKTLAALLRGDFAGAWNNAKETVSQFASNVKSLITNLGENVGNTLKNLGKNALNWGRDMMQNFINGIQEKWNALKDTVSHTAQTVKDFLGFSEPKMGPLSNFHTYAPDMMELFAKGIRDNTDVVTNQIDKSFDFGEKTVDFGANVTAGRNGYMGGGEMYGGYGYGGNASGVGEQTINVDVTLRLDDGTVLQKFAHRLRPYLNTEAALAGGAIG